MENLNAAFFSFFFFFFFFVFFCFSVFCQNYQKFCLESIARNSFLTGDISEVFSKFIQFPVFIISGGRDKLFCISRDDITNQSRGLVGEIPSP